ncbi:hypothetical protein GCM10010172_70670 [Paractinoplanes ferrugineus]|uniref:Uncharacterized protein n=1 Tax=Paractinoplanes ferrugineus TaxID=113564 RepID=A0A919ME57_9ACTN|nr:hypothetical protein [Actinoplanes ferrugineus]GIE12438.1 hypothetical protein Afe05nite_42780 [Actinoplanes ferrugineus]
MSIKDEITTKGAWLAKRSFLYIALGLLVVYFVGAYLVLELDAGKFEKPFLGSTLFLLLVAALGHAASQGRSQQKLERIESELGSVTGGLADLAAHRNAEVAFFAGNSRVYDATVRAVLAARERVWVTHMRNEGPLRGDAADRHFKACREWALRSEEHHFRRIILRGDNPGLRDFCRQELKFAAKANARGDRYLVKILSGPVHLTEAFNVGIYDDVVFFTHRDGDQAIGFSVRSREFADNYIQHYYNRLWHNENSEPISADLLD